MQQPGGSRNPVAICGVPPPIYLGWVPTRKPTPEDRATALRLTLTGLATGQTLDAIFDGLRALHVPNNTFTAEELLGLASDALDEAGATPADPIDAEGIRERLLPEYRFSGKTVHYKSKYAISAAGMIHGGVSPDLLGDAAWWRADDLWIYALFALLLYVRAAAERTDRSTEQVAVSIADRHGIPVAPTEA